MTDSNFTGSNDKGSNYTAPDITLLGAEHVRVYQETGGERGYLWNGVPTLLLTTVGRRTGESRTVPLIFGRDGDNLLVVASKGGAPAHPLWYENLAADPAVSVQVRGDQGAFIASTAQGAEHDRLWKVVVEQWPNYDTYQSRTDRPIPLVVLTPKTADDVLT